MKNPKDIRCNFEAEYSNYVIMNLNIINQPLGQGELSGGYAPTKKRIWPAIIMAATAIGSAAYSGYKSSQANKKAQQQLDAEKATTKNEKRRRLNEDYIDTSAGQNLIRVARSEADKVYKREAGAAAMTGATERTAMAKQYGNDMVGETISNIAANDTARKDKIESEYTGYERQLNQQQIALDQQKAQNEAQAGAQLISGLGGAAAAYMGTYMGAGSPGGGGVTAPQPTGQLAGMGKSNSFFENYAGNYIKNNMYGGSNIFTKQSPLFSTDYKQFFGLN